MAIWLSLGISLTALIFSVYSSQALSDANVSLKKHLIAKTQLQQLMALLVEAESSQRGYILTGKENYLTPYYNAT
ncbi:CHASE3 domain-containing protein, partial [Acinetobacter baumannii]